VAAGAVAAALLLALAGCGLPANVVVLLPDENGTVGKVAVHEGGSTAELTRPLAAVNAGSEASLRNVFTAQRSDVDSEFAGALAAAPRAPVAHVLYFRTGSTELDPSSRDPLAAAMAAAKGNANVDISVVGHADAPRDRMPITRHCP
jgi:OOP family OmpA-OmpF porin